MSPVQVWERGLFLQPYGSSTLNREVERFPPCPPNCKAKVDLFLPQRAVVRRWPLTIAAIVFGSMYVNVGVQHFTNTAWFEPIVPAILGDPTIWVLITGVMEIAIGVGLVLPQTRSRAALGSIIFLAGIYWANLNMWYNNIPLDGKTYAHHWHVLRLVAQLGMMGLSYAIWRGSMAEGHDTKAI